METHFTLTSYGNDHTVYSHHDVVYVMTFTINGVLYYKERQDGAYTDIQPVPPGHTFESAISTKDADVASIVNAKLRVYRNRCKIANIPFNHNNIDRILVILGFGYTSVGWTLDTSGSTLDIDPVCVRSTIHTTGKKTVFPYTKDGLRSLVTSLII